MADEQNFGTGSVEELLAIIGSKEVFIQRQAQLIERQRVIIAQQADALTQLTPQESAEEQTKVTTAKE